AIANIKANAGGPVYTSGWGHTVVIKAISGDTLTVLEQNFAGHQYVEERTYSASAYLGVVQTVCYPPEIVQGKRINGTTEPTPDSTTETSTTSEEKTITISNTLYREWKNDKGDVEFYVKNGMLYAPISKDLYPSAFSGRETDDNWIRKDIEVQTDAEEVLISTALATLRKNAYPAITYEVVGYVANLDVGDTVKISDKEYSPSLTLEARVSEQHISFTEPNQNKTVFDNYKALENKTSSILIDRMNDMAEEAKPYDLRLITDNGTTFKNSTGRSVLTAELWKSNKKFNATYQFKNGDELISAGMQLAVDASSITLDKPLIVTVDAYIGNDFVASKQVTFTNTVDGSAGRGITSTEDYYLVSASKTGITSATTGWVKGTPQVPTPTNKYHWHYRVDNYSDSTKKETVPAIIGVYGDKGPAGALDEKQLQDINDKIDSKADLALTQAQLLALEERTSLVRENAIAEAMQNAISEVETRYKLWYETTTKDEKQKVASDIASLFDRTVELNQKLGEASAKFEFINNETLIGEEGVAIGDKEGKAKLFMSQDSISFVTNGTAQMTLTGDTLMIKNGLFTERIQIGKYVEEVYDANPNFNVIRYIG
ncbi:phage tail protein, partial [Streptococcus iniae]